MSKNGNQFPIGSDVPIRHKIDKLVALVRFNGRVWVVFLCAWSLNGTYFERGTALPAPDALQKGVISPEEIEALPVENVSSGYMRAGF